MAMKLKINEQDEKLEVLNEKLDIYLVQLWKFIGTLEIILRNHIVIL